MTESQKLLLDYARTGSEKAFGELVRRYIDLVYSTAFRLMDGDAHRAEDVAQTVFSDLSRLAGGISKDVMPGGWLHRHTCFVAAKLMRGERRRKLRESQAAEMNQLNTPENRFTDLAPVLDAAINELGDADRKAILLRFYEQCDLRSIGEALGTSENAAQKRVTRALDQLHSIITRRGIALSAAALATTLSGAAVSAAPAGLAASILETVLAGAAEGTGTAFTIPKLMATAKLKTGVSALVILASAVMPLVVLYQGQAKLREQDDARKRQINELTEMTVGNQRLANLVARSKSDRPLSDNHLTELLRLRGTVGRFRRNVQEMTLAKSAPSPSVEDQLESMKQGYSVQVERLKQWLETNPSEKIPELQNVSQETWINAVDTLATDDDFSRAAAILRANAEHRVFETLWPALRQYVRDNEGRFPTDLSELKPYFKSPIEDAILERYAILPATSLVSELQPGGKSVITEKAAANPALDSRSAYGLTDMRMADERVTNRWTLVH